MVRRSGWGSRHTLSVHRGQTGGGFWSHTVGGPHKFCHCVSSTASVKRETSSVIVCLNACFIIPCIGIRQIYTQKKPSNSLYWHSWVFKLLLSSFPTPGADMAVAPDNFHMFCSTSFLNPSSNVSHYRRQREEMHKSEKKKAEASPCHVI